MKKSILLFASVLFLASCGNSAKKDEVVEAVAETVEVADPAHNAQNSLDYEGIYQGELPTASGEGMKVTITLGKDDYTKEVLYIGKETTPTKTAGTYKWDEAGTIITLEGQDKPNQYFIGENTLTQLDIDGNKITGDMADKYVLSKTK